MANGDFEQFPLLLLARPTPVEREGGQGFPPTVHFPDHARQGQRIGERLRRLQDRFDARRLELRQNVQNDDPDLVLVLETVGSLDDFISSAQRVPGLEWLGAVDGEIDPDEDFYDVSDKHKPLGGKFFLIGSNRAALAEIIRLWELYRDNQAANLGKGLSAWKSAFSHLKDARFWSPADRLTPSLRENWRFRIDQGEESIRFEIEAWHFAAPAKNAAVANNIRTLVGQLGGTIVDAFQLPSIAYHGFLVDMPAVGVAELIEGDAAPLLRSESVMFFRAQGQAIAPQSRPTEHAFSPAIRPQIAEGEPVVALLDGLPLANHPLLQGRLEIDDPDGWGDDYPAVERCHGTAMASLIALGDLELAEPPLERPIYVRPIMKPVAGLGRQVERTPEDRLLLDLVHGAVRRMFEGGDGEPGTVPGIRVINLSIGDPQRLFSGEMSPWARLLDWLQFKYNVLFIVSSGNALDNELVLDTNAGTLQGMPVRARSVFATRAVFQNDMHRRIMAPAESINALTVGATHSDASTINVVPGRFQIFADDGLTPYSCIGPGFRRAIKPDILLPGGRILYREAIQSPAGQTRVHPIFESVQPPGQLAAAPPSPQGTAVYTRGSSNAAAIGTRWAAKAHSVINVLRAGNPNLEPKYDAVLIKALLAHGAALGDIQADILAARPDVTDWYAQRRLVSRYAGFGAADVERALSCTAQRATLLGVGELRNEKALEFRVPIPHVLHAMVVSRRISVTLAWISPINPRNSKYRVARLWADIPDGPLRGGRAEGEWRQLRQGTVHHEVFVGDAAVPILEDTSLPIRVNCLADAGRIVEPVKFALCVTLAVSEEVDLPIYQQVRERVGQRVEIHAGN